MTRIQAARTRVTVARYVIGVSAAAALAAFAAVARVSHPATHSTRTQSASTSSSSTASEDDSFFGDDDSSSFIGPSGSATPQVQSGAS
jgi:hypothetical protein